MSRIGLASALLVTAIAVGCKPSKPSGGGTAAAGGAEAKQPGAAPQAGAPAAAASPPSAGAGPGAPGASACTGSGPSLIKNGSFETPATRPGGYDLYDTGKDMGGWTVVGDPGNVAPLSGTFAEAGFTFPAQDGAQSVDMTGTTDSATGVSQTIATMPGKTYCLSFWIGNVSDPGGGFGTTSAIAVRIDGKQVTVSTNEGDTGKKTVEWRRFTVPFTAASASTKIELINADPKGDTSNLLDSVAVN